MTRGQMVISTFMMAGLMTVAVAHVAGEVPDDTRPFEVRVIDAREKGVPKIAVEVVAPDRPRRSFTTGDDGRLTIPAGVAVEGAVLSAVRGREAVAWAQVGDPMQAHHDGTQGLPIVMKLLPRSNRVEGSVVDRQGRPIAGVRLVAQSLFHPTNRLMDQDAGGKEPLLGVVESDAEGKFALTLPPGARARLRASHPRYLGPAIEVSENTRALSPVTLAPAGVIVGRVTDATTGKPVAGAAVAAQLIDRPRQMLGDGWGQSVTDDQGRFLVGGLGPGVYNLLLLEVPGRRHATATAVEGVRVNGGSEATASLSVLEGRPLRGVVIDRGNGRAMAGAQVGCQGPAAPRSGAGIMGTKTDARGRFTFHVPPGEQFVFLIDDVSSSRMSRRIAVVPEEGEVIPLFLLQPPPRSPDAVPPPPRDGIAIEADGPGVMTREVPAGAPARALAIARDFVAAVAVSPPAVAPPAGMTVEIRTATTKAAVKAEPPRTVTGRVRDENGRPLAGLRVGLETAESRRDGLREQPVSVATDREGLFVLRGLPREPFSIILSRPRHSSQAAIVPADRDEIELNCRFRPDDNARNQAALIEDESIPAQLRPRLTFVNLTPYGTNYLTDGPGPRAGNNLDRLPRGVHKLADSYFRIGETMVQVQSQFAPNMPASVTGIKVAARGEKLQVLHATEQQTEPGTELGNYVIHYADGSREKIPIVYGCNLIDWWQFPSREKDPSGARIAWTGDNEMLDGRKSENLKIRLFAFTWTNPHPDREIATIDVVSSHSACDPYLIAVTLERER